MLSPIPLRTTALALSKRQFPRTTSHFRNRLNPSQNNGRFFNSQASERGSGYFLPWILASSVALALGYSLGRLDSKTLTEKQKATSALASKSTTSLAEMPTAMYDLSQKNIEELVEQMIALLGPDRVNTQLGPRIAHSSTAWSAAPDGEKDIPSMIVLPKKTEEVSAIAKACHQRRVPMIAFSGGTSLEGTLAMTSRGGVCIDFNLMNEVVALHPKDMDVVVQPGVGYEDLNALLAPQGLFFPPDPGPGAKIGGMISQGCSGTNAYRHGTMKDWVLGLTMVLADGTIVKTRHRPRKSSAGYNLTQVGLFSPHSTLVNNNNANVGASS
jgi:hypothetical protein